MTSKNTPVKTKSRFPISVNELKPHLDIYTNETDNDDYLDFLIKSSTRAVENFIDKDVAYTSNVLTEYDFYDDFIRVNEGNLVSVSDISINGTSKNTYELQKFDDRFTIEWDSAFGGDDYTLSLSFITGYDPDDVPEDIKLAVMVMCKQLFDIDRGGYTYNSLVKSNLFERLLYPYRCIRW